MVLSTEERIFLIEHVFRANGEYTKAVKEKFAKKFPETALPHRNAVRALVNKIRETGSVHDASRSGRPTILTEQKVNVISEAITKSMRRLSQQVNVSVGTAHAAVRKALSLYPYRVTCQHELKDRL